MPSVFRCGNEMTPNRYHSNGNGGQEENYICVTRCKTNNNDNERYQYTKTNQKHAKEN